MIHFRQFRGKEAYPCLGLLADLRIKIFRDFPYLYDGDLNYEKKYLETYFSSANSYVAICYDADRAIGACTAILLADEQKEFQQAFLEKNIDTNKICYFGESILEKEYRGKGIGNLFMDMRINFAKELRGVNQAVFCAVIRSPAHPEKPKDYVPLDNFWIKRGFQKLIGFEAEYAWKDIGEETESQKKMQFWRKEL
jgi:GNAT superfamily N-acetyltransferase